MRLKHGVTMRLTWGDLEVNMGLTWGDHKVNMG